MGKGNHAEKAKKGPGRKAKKQGAPDFKAVLDNPKKKAKIVEQVQEDQKENLSSRQKQRLKKRQEKEVKAKELQANFKANKDKGKKPSANKKSEKKNISNADGSDDEDDWEDMGSDEEGIPDEEQDEDDGPMPGFTDDNQDWLTPAKKSKGNEKAKNKKEKKKA